MLVEAATVTVNGDTYYNAVNVKSGLITTNTKNGLILSPKGNRLTFTLNVANGFSATVKAGETIYTPRRKKGIYTIPKLTNDLSIDIKFDVNSFKKFSSVIAKIMYTFRTVTQSTIFSDAAAQPLTILLR